MKRPTFLLLLVAFSRCFGSELCVPRPPGLIDGAAVSATIRQSGMIGKPTDSKLHGVYYPTNALAEILSAGIADACEFGKAFSKNYRSSSESSNAFAKTVLAAKKEDFSSAGAKML